MIRLSRDLFQKYYASYCVGKGQDLCWEVDLTSCGSQIDLYKVYDAVANLGGHHLVSQLNQWDIIFQAVTYTSEKPPGIAQATQGLFDKHLKDFVQHLEDQSKAGVQIPNEANSYYDFLPGSAAAANTTGAALPTPSANGVPASLSALQASAKSAPSAVPLSVSPALPGSGDSSTTLSSILGQQPSTPGGSAFTPAAPATGNGSIHAAALPSAATLQAPSAACPPSSAPPAEHSAAAPAIVKMEGSGSVQPNAVLQAMTPTLGGTDLLQDKGGQAMSTPQAHSCSQQANSIPTPPCNTATPAAEAAPGPLTLKPRTDNTATPLQFIQQGTSPHATLQAMASLASSTGTSQAAFTKTPSAHNLQQLTAAAPPTQGNQPNAALAQTAAAAQLLSAGTLSANGLQGPLPGQPTPASAPTATQVGAATAVGQTNHSSALAGRSVTITDLQSQLLSAEQQRLAVLQQVQAFAAAAAAAAAVGAQPGGLPSLLQPSLLSMLTSASPDLNTAVSAGPALLSQLQHLSVLNAAGLPPNPAAVAQALQSSPAHPNLPSVSSPPQAPMAAMQSTLLQPAAAIATQQAATNTNQGLGTTSTSSPVQASAPPREITVQATPTIKLTFSSSTPITTITIPADGPIQQGMPYATRITLTRPVVAPQATSSAPTSTPVPKLPSSTQEVLPIHAHLSTLPTANPPAGLPSVLPSTAPPPFPAAAAAAAAAFPSTFLGAANHVPASSPLAVAMAAVAAASARGLPASLQHPSAIQAALAQTNALTAGLLANLQPNGLTPPSLPANPAASTLPTSQAPAFTDVVSALTPQAVAAASNAANQALLASGLSMAGLLDPKLAALGNTLNLRPSLTLEQQAALMGLTPSPALSQQPGQGLAGLPGVGGLHQPALPANPVLSQVQGFLSPDGVAAQNPLLSHLAPTTPDPGTSSLLQPAPGVRPSPMPANLAAYANLQTSGPQPLDHAPLGSTPTQSAPAGASRLPVTGFPNLTAEGLASSLATLTGSAAANSTPVGGQLPGAWPSYHNTANTGTQQPLFSGSGVQEMLGLKPSGQPGGATQQPPSSTAAMPGLPGLPDMSTTPVPCNNSASHLQRLISGQHTLNPPVTPPPSSSGLGHRSASSGSLAQLAPPARSSTPTLQQRTLITGSNMPTSSPFPTTGLDNLSTAAASGYTMPQPVDFQALLDNAAAARATPPPAQAHSARSVAEMQAILASYQQPNLLAASQPPPDALTNNITHQQLSNLGLNPLLQPGSTLPTSNTQAPLPPALQLRSPTPPPAAAGPGNMPALQTSLGTPTAAAAAGLGPFMDPSLGYHLQLSAALSFPAALTQLPVTSMTNAAHPSIPASLLTSLPLSLGLAAHVASQALQAHGSPLSLPIPTLSPQPLQWPLSADPTLPAALHAPQGTLADLYSRQPASGPLSAQGLAGPGQEAFITAHNIDHYGGITLGAGNSALRPFPTALDPSLTNLPAAVLSSVFAPLATIPASNPADGHTHLQQSSRTPLATDACNLLPASAGMSTAISQSSLPHAASSNSLNSGHAAAAASAPPRTNSFPQLSQISPVNAANAADPAAAVGGQTAAFHAGVALEACASSNGTSNNGPARTASDAGNMMNAFTPGAGSMMDMLGDAVSGPVGSIAANAMNPGPGGISTVNLGPGGNHMSSAINPLLLATSAATPPSLLAHTPVNNLATPPNRSVQMVDASPRGSTRVTTPMASSMSADNAAQQSPAIPSRMVDLADIGGSAPQMVRVNSLTMLDQPTARIPDTPQDINQAMNPPPGLLDVHHTSDLPANVDMDSLLDGSHFLHSDGPASHVTSPPELHLLQAAQAHAAVASMPAQGTAVAAAAAAAVASAAEPDYLGMLVDSKMQEVQKEEVKPRWPAEHPARGSGQLFESSLASVMLLENCELGALDNLSPIAGLPHVKRDFEDMGESQTAPVAKRRASQELDDICGSADDLPEDLLGP